MFVIVRKNPDGSMVYLKSTKRNKMVTKDKRYKLFSKKKTAEYWMEELKLENCEIIETDDIKPKRIRKGQIDDNTDIINEEEENIDDFEEEEEDDPWILFKELNPQCLKCKKECKQSSKISIIWCPDFKKNRIK